MRKVRTVIAQQMAEVIRAHQITAGAQVSSGTTCRCGYWTGDEIPGVTRPPGFTGLAWHQAQELLLAGFGLVIAK